MAGGIAIRRELQHELSKLSNEEAAIETELRQYFTDLSGGRSLHTNKSFDSDLSSSLKKIERFTPGFEAMVENSKKLGSQVEDCRSLSDRLSMLVRQLDTIQIRAQQALACTEDIINLKDSKVRISAAVDAGDLSLAVSIIRQVHDIDLQAAKASDDFGAIQQAEKELKGLVESEFVKAIDESNIARVMSLCPLLQTLGLEVEARDKFLDFVEKNVFIAISADASAVDGATDPATGYAQALSNVFNSAYLIFQQYLPMVIQGMENSLGDIYFIRRLHAKCELESGLVLKRYMKFRHIKSTFSTIKTSAVAAVVSLGKTQQVTPADVHAILDEIALLIQYCRLYSKYLKQLCDGAQGRKRTLSPMVSANPAAAGVASADKGISNSGVSPAPSASSSASSSSTSSPPMVFSGPTDFDKMIDELINRYYMEGEQFLMKQSVKSALAVNAGIGIDGSSGLDESFFVLQRCGQRAIATNSIQAACAVLHVIADSLSTDLLQQVNDSMSSAVAKVAPIIQEQLSRFTQASCGGTADSLSTASISKGIKNAMSLASSITAGATSSISTATAAADDGDDAELTKDKDDVSDPHGLAAALAVFNIAERCGKYTERLTKDILLAGESVFGGTVDHSAAADARSFTVTGAPAMTPDMEKLKLCREDLDSAKHCFQQALRQGAEKLVLIAQGQMKEILVNILGRNGPLGGIKFDAADEKFDSQPAVSLLPKVLIAPFEILIDMCTVGLTDANREFVIGLLADASSERLEHFISQSTFRFAGALKFEECVRALSSMFARMSNGPIRGKFSRLREVMLVLTSDVSSSGVPNILTENFSLLTTSEIQAFAALRVDSNGSEEY